MTTPKTDIIISIHPKHVLNIINRSKNHEYRTYLLPATIEKIWIYQTAPISAITHVARISPGKLPGEITNLDGENNEDFNEGKLGGYAYEILGLWEVKERWTVRIMAVSL